MSDIARYQFLANAIAGRRVVLQISANADQRAFSDGQSITIPASHAQEATLCWMEIAAQAALIAAGSLQPRILKHLVGRQGASWRYLYLEALRIRCVLADTLPVQFVDHVAWGAAGALSRSADESLALALQTGILPPPPPFFGALRPLSIVARALSNEGVAVLTRQQREHGLKQAPAAVAEIPEEDEAQESTLLKLFSNPLFSGGFAADLLSKILGAGMRKSAGRNTSADVGGSEMPVGPVEHTARRGDSSTLVEEPFDLPQIAVEPPTAAHVYPEWDIGRNAYRPRWVFAESLAPAREDGPRDISHLLADSSIRELRRQLASLGLTHQMHRRQLDGADLDLGALLDHAIDRSAGHSGGEPRVYRANRCTRRDLGVVIVLDVSGSTGEGQSSDLSQFDKQLQIAYQLGRAFDALGDTVEIFGFHSWGRSLVRWRPVKAHDERWSAAVTERFAQLEPAGYTHLGAAIRHGEHLLRTAIRLPHRLMLLVTDGLPYDHDYESAYAEADVRKSLEEARAAGTACLCLCVDSATDTHKLRTMFGTANLIAVDKPLQIAAQIRARCRTALAGVSRRSVNRMRVA